MRLFRFPARVPAQSGALNGLARLSPFRAAAVPSRLCRLLMGGGVFLRAVVVHAASVFFLRGAEMATDGNTSCDLVMV